MSISKLGQRRQIVIPKIICDEIGIKIGDFLEVLRVENNVIIIKPKKLVDLEHTVDNSERKISGRKT